MKQLLISLIVDHVLQQEPHAFFVGKNVNEITGILGEIQGLFYISTFLRSKNSNANLIWKGGKISGNSSHKPHQDLLLDEKFGIQVKNTTKDILNEQSKVGFSENTLDYLLSSKLNLNENIIEIFRTYYGTLNFNVPYHRDEGIYLPEIRETDKNALKFMLFRIY